MESRFRLFLLTATLLLSPLAQAADNKQPSPNPDAGQTEPFKQIIQQESVIQPDIKRRQVKESQIDTENFEVGVFVGLLSIEDFGTNSIIGARLAYHVTEDFFFEGTYALSEGGTTSADNFGPPLLSTSQREYTFYTAALGYNFLPGEAFLGRGLAFNTSLYLVAGIGNTEFGGENRFTAMFGAGYRLILKDWLAVHANARDHIFSIDITGQEKNAHNIEISLGLTYFF